MRKRESILRKNVGDMVEIRVYSLKNNRVMRIKLTHPVSTQLGFLKNVSFYFQVKKNRTVIGKIIDVVRLLGKLNLPFRGHRKDKNSLNKGMFKVFLEHIAKSDSLIEDNLRNSAGNYIIHLFLEGSWWCK
jgi:hypothetical protein